jgi:transcription elongation factor Elf1
MTSPTRVAGEATTCELPKYNPNQDYYQLYWDLYLQNENLMASVCNESCITDDLVADCAQIEMFYDDNVEKLSSERYLHNGRKRHNRRCADELEKDFICPYEACNKLYGSEGSLNLHIKLKHNGGNKTDREKIAKSLVYANAKGLNLPVEQLTQQLNLPPKIVYTAAESVGVDLDSKVLKSLEESLRKQNII